MSYAYPYYGQPYQYQEQLAQLRNPMPMQPQPFQPAQPKADSGGVNWVQGESGAKSWIVTPGAMVLLMDSEAQRFYLKSCDPNGIPAMRTFEYSEVQATRLTQPTQQPQFVTVDEFNQFKTEIMSRLPEVKEGVTNE